MRRRGPGRLRNRIREPPTLSVAQRSRQVQLSVKRDPLPPWAPAEKVTASEDQAWLTARTISVLLKTKRADRRKQPARSGSSSILAGGLRRRAYDGDAPGREDHRLPGAGRAVQHRRWDRE